MLSIADKKLVRKLRQKKYRLQFQQFIAEGPKVIKDLQESGFQAKKIWTLDGAGFENAEAISQKDLKDISNLSTPNQVIGLFAINEKPINFNCNCLVLDGINDPGNLGTVIRTADWFGFKQIFCVNNTTDVYSPKVIQSTMGSLARVGIHYCEEEELLEKLLDYQKLVADMQGQSLQSFKKEDKKIALVLGSESHGPSDFWCRYSEKITIPKMSDSKVDSLNVGVAAAICMYQLA